MIALLRIVLRLLADLAGLIALSVRPRRAIEAENLVLRRQLALFKERGTKPRRIDAATRKLGLAVAVLRLALLPGDRRSGNRCGATEPAGDYSGAASRDRGVRRFLSTYGDSCGAWPGRIRYGARKELQTSCC